MFEKDDKEVNLIILIKRPKIIAPFTTKDKKPPLKPQKKSKKKEGFLQQIKW